MIFWKSNFKLNYLHILHCTHDDMAKSHDIHFNNSTTYTPYLFVVFLIFLKIALHSKTIINPFVLNKIFHIQKLVLSYLASFQYRLSDFKTAYFIEL